MPSGFTENKTQAIIDDALQGVELVIFTTAPTFADDASDGVEVVGGGYDSPAVVFGPAVDGTGVRTGQTANTSQALIQNMPVASSAVNGYGLRYTATGVIFFVDQDWTPTDAFTVGGNLLVQPGDLVIYGTPAA